MLAIPLLLSATAPARAGDIPKNARVLPLSIDPDSRKAVVLLALEKDRNGECVKDELRWGSIGGATEGRSFEETAVVEFTQETGRSPDTDLNIFDTIQLRKSRYKLSAFDYRSQTYLVPMRYLTTEGQSPDLRARQPEIERLAWIEISQLENAIEGAMKGKKPLGRCGASLSTSPQAGPHKKLHGLFVKGLASAGPKVYSLLERLALRSAKEVGETEPRRLQKFDTLPTPDPVVAFIRSSLPASDRTGSLRSRVGLAGVTGTVGNFSDVPCVQVIARLLEKIRDDVAKLETEVDETMPASDAPSGHESPTDEARESTVQIVSGLDALSGLRKIPCGVGDERIVQALREAVLALQDDAAEQLARYIALSSRLLISRIQVRSKEKKLENDPMDEVAKKVRLEGVLLGMKADFEAAKSEIEKQTKLQKAAEKDLDETQKLLTNKGCEELMKKEEDPSKADDLAICKMLAEREAADKKKKKDAEAAVVKAEKAMKELSKKAEKTAGIETDGTLDLGKLYEARLRDAYGKSVTWAEVARVVRENAFIARGYLWSKDRLLRGGDKREHMKSYVMKAIGARHRSQGVPFDLLWEDTTREPNQSYLDRLDSAERSWRDKIGAEWEVYQRHKHQVDQVLQSGRTRFGSVYVLNNQGLSNALFLDLWRSDRRPIKPTPLRKIVRNIPFIGEIAHDRKHQRRSVLLTDTTEKIHVRTFSVPKVRLQVGFSENVEWDSGSKSANSVLLGFSRRFNPFLSFNVGWAQSLKDSDENGAYVGLSVPLKNILGIFGGGEEGSDGDK